FAADFPGRSRLGPGPDGPQYSTLLDAPRTVSAPLQPQINAPVVTPSNTIDREPDAAVQSADSGAAATSAEPEEPADNAIAPAPEAVATAAPATPPRVRSPAEVRAGDTLSEIAQQLGLGGSLDQTMIALLRSNPDAFIGGNINLLKQGVVLRIPD